MAHIPNMTLDEQRSYLEEYYNGIGHSEAVADLVALLNESQVRYQAMVLRVQDYLGEVLDYGGPNQEHNELYDNILSMLNDSYTPEKD